MSLLYKNSYTLTGPQGNNAFSYTERAILQEPQLYIPSCILGTVQDLAQGTSIVFEDYEDGKLQSCTGLKNFIQTTYKEKIPVYIFDNHNHAFAFWMEEYMKGTFSQGQKLVHVDQHRDMREAPVCPFILEDVTSEKVWEYTNHVLNVGNFIRPALEIGLFSNVQFVEKSMDFEHVVLPETPYVLDIDIDIFADHMDYLDFAKVRDAIKVYMHHASMITIATSPFFIDQQRAIEEVKKLFVE